MSFNKPIRRIAIVGTGVIGASWAAQYLARGLDVVATDPAPNAEENLRKYVDDAWEQLTAIGLSPGASRNRLSFTTNMKDALSEADLVLENGPERPDFKIKLFADMDAATPPDSIIASSSSGITMSVKSGRSGPFSWTRSASDNAFFMSEVKLSLSRDPFGESPMAVRAGHAESTYLRIFASAFGAGSVAITSNPRAKNSAAQLAPITPVPTMAIRRTGLFKDMFVLLLTGGACPPGLAFIWNSLHSPTPRKSPLETNFVGN